MALFKFTKAILAGEKVAVFNYGKMTRNFTYIDDIVNGVIAALKKSYPYEIFNLGNNKTVPLRTFIKHIEKELGKKADLELLPMQQGDIPDSLANIEHAESLLDFHPRTDVEEGVKQFIAWYKEYYNV
jgi:UDP-glucuronate 4-epimerase